MTKLRLAALCATACAFAAVISAQSTPMTIVLTGQSMVRSDLRTTAPSAVPTIKAMLSGGAAGVESLNINFVDIFVKLLISFMVPTVLGKALRELVPAVFRFQREYKTTLSVISNTNLVSAWGWL